MSKILIITKENDPYGERLPEIFRRLGYDTLSMYSVGDAAKYIADGDVYAVFVDLDAVSDSSSLEALVKVAKPYSMVLLHGSEKQTDMICRAFELGADDYLRKPYYDDIFESRLKSIFQRYDHSRNIHIGNLESFLDTMPSMMVITDGRGKLLYANDTFRNKYGLSKELTSGKMLCDALSCENKDKEGGVCMGNCEFCKIFDYEREVFATGKRAIRKTTTYPQIREGKAHNKTIRFSMAPIDYGNSKAVIVNIEDITFERNAINELTSTICSLRESRDNSQDQEKVSRELAAYFQNINDSLQKEKTKLQLLFDNMTSGFMLAEYKNDSLYFREGNSKLSEITKTDLTKRIGNRLKENNDLYPTDFYKALLNVAETGRSVSFNSTSTDQTKEYKVNIYIPEPDFVAAIINDITEETRVIRENRERAKQLRRLNIMLDDRNNELQKAIETKNKFISIIAHDLRNPLNAINGLSELLSRRLDPEIDARAVEMAKVLHQSAKGAYELLDNLLIWARTQQNTIQFAPETLNLHDVTHDTIDEIKVQAQRKHIMLINNTETDNTVWADKLMLQTIIRNIVSNAIKFTNEGGLIVIGSSQTADATEITIEDNGVGMTQDTKDKLMDAAEIRSTKGTSGETGTGMGLIITKEFIQRHKGKLVVESTIGKGSLFTITLPNEKK